MNNPRSDLWLIGAGLSSARLAGGMRQSTGIHGPEDRPALSDHRLGINASSMCRTIGLPS